VRDVFDRPLGNRGLTLPDWEGYMANPAIELSVRAAAGQAEQLQVSTGLPLIHFDLPSRTGDQGSSKTLALAAGQAARLFVAAFPQREKLRTKATLTVSGATHSCRVNVEIIPVSSGDQSSTSPFTLDFSQDQTGLFNNPSYREVARQAVADWVFFLQDHGAPATAQGKELTWVFDKTGFKTGRVVPNANAFHGFLLYAYGIGTEALRSGGEPNLARSGGPAAPPPLRPRSGGVEIEVAGNYNRLGWMDPADAERRWWRATNLYEAAADLYSIFHHESGHAMFFNPGHPGFARKSVIHTGAAGTTRLALKVDEHDHFPGTIDSASLRGVFGNEFHGLMPLGRWLITRTDLLAVAALGHPMRPVAALQALAFEKPALPRWTAGCNSSYQLRASGGLPYYDWQVVEGKLPAGLMLDRFTGTLSGTVSKSQVVNVVVQLRDLERTTIRQPVRLNVIRRSAPCAGTPSRPSPD
jgi:hypothetical protein